MKTIDEKLIRITGKFPIPKEMELGKDYRVLVYGSVVKTEDSDNQDGTVNRTYVVKGYEGVTDEN